MMAESWANSSRDIYNYGQCINQFLLNTIKAIWQYEQIQKKICRQKMSIMFNEICIYIYIYEGCSKSSKPNQDFKFVAHLSALYGHTWIENGISFSSFIRSDSGLPQ